MNKISSNWTRLFVIKSSFTFNTVFKTCCFEIMSMIKQNRKRKQKRERDSKNEEGREDER